ncbi:MAG: hypothetical protein SVS85_00775 [Candidatus Nanohaloarchaea archaeon]|nr:hypothetical protein [Candidatus Nanohaloarchaea archaeon]
MESETGRKGALSKGVVLIMVIVAVAATIVIALGAHQTVLDTIVGSIKGMIANNLPGGTS